MRLVLLCLAAMLAAGPAVAGNPQSPATGGESSPRQDGRTAPSPAQAADASPSGVVSLDRIRQGLKKQVRDSLLLRPEIPADFRVQILEQQKIDDMLSKLDFTSGQGPAPAGGLYGYEQQRRLFNPVDRPLAQPYAAFSGGELITIAIENLIARYFGPKLVSSVTGAQRERAERAARDEVAREVAAYCATRPDRADIYICALPMDK
jgi:hypothetical protein